MHRPWEQSSATAADRVFRIAMALTSLSAGACRIGPVILMAKPIAGHGAERRAARTPARTIRMPPVSSIWIPGPETGISPGSSGGLEPGRRPCPGTPRRSRPPRPRPSGRRPMRLPERSSPFRHHAERRGRSGRTRADPPLSLHRDDQRPGQKKRPAGWYPFAGIARIRSLGVAVQPLSCPRPLSLSSRLRVAPGIPFGPAPSITSQTCLRCMAPMPGANTGTSTTTHASALVPVEDRPAAGFGGLCSMSASTWWPRAPGGAAAPRHRHAPVRQRPVRGRL